jgi:hypothetical protein
MVQWRNRGLAAVLGAVLLAGAAGCKGKGHSGFRGGAPLEPGAPIPAQFLEDRYPPTPEGMKNEITRLLDKANTQPSPTPSRALVVPHAGLQFSGSTAAEAFAAVRDRRVDRVIILAAAHHPVTGAVMPAAHAMATLLGDMTLDGAATAFLATQPGFKRDDNPFRDEPSVELVLPFVQRALGQVPIVPILVGPQDVKGARVLADALRTLVDARTLVVVSTHITEYGPRFDYTAMGALNGADLRSHIKQADEVLFKPLLAGQLEPFDALVRSTGSKMCGADALRVLLALKPGGDAATLKYENSFNHDAQDNESQVSYAAIAYKGSWPDVAPFAPEDQALLLKTAHDAVAATLAAQPLPRPSGGTGRMVERHGAFVTLFVGHEPHGSIGTAASELPLITQVAQLAQAAATDSRYPPLTPSDLAQLRVEVSVLGPMRPAKLLEELRPGVDGVFLGMPGHTAMVLPQVATEQGLNLEGLLDAVAAQATLDRPKWDPLAVRSFTAQVVADPAAADKDAKP